ncbi:SPASM domain-containing protein [bacterium]|nr:SPASM domain-containing protein [bacterium]
MKFEQFKFLWDSIQPTPLLLQLWNQGEPLLNPELAKIVNYAASQNCWVTLSSNVELLADRHKADSLVQSGLYELILSLDGASKETYSQYRVGGDFERVWIGIQNVVQSRKLNRSKYPIITWQYLLFKHTLAEVEKAKRLAKEWGVDKIVFKTAQLEDLSKSEGQRWLPDQSELRRYDLKKDRWQLRRSSNYFCKRIFSSAVIQWDGTVVPCCFDKTGEFIVGDAAVVGFPVVWSGKEFQAFRRNWLRGIRPEICSNCTEGLKNLYVNPRFVEI